MAKIFPFTAQLNQLNHLLPTLAQQYHRLVLIVGSHKTGKTPLLKEFGRQQNIPYLNVNLYLSQRLLDLTTKQRPLRVRRILAQIIADYSEPTLTLDNIELLFEPDLHQDPLALLKELSRNKSLIVAWGGTYDDKRQILTYAAPGHREYRRYDRPEVLMITT